MTVHAETSELSTRGFPEVLDLSSRIAEFLERCKADAGLLTVFVPGSTSAVTALEFEPGLLEDLPALCRRLAPPEAAYRHDLAWHDGNGYAHLLAALFKPSLSVPVAGGKPALGKWQQVVLADFDNRPRRRRVLLQFIGTTRP